MDIYSNFKPTFLYIKRHTKTGMLYFGKTTRDPEKYQGSGIHWKRHIKKHGCEFVETLWYCLFLDQNLLTEFALQFSKDNDIVESVEWANLQEENGIDGAPIGHAGHEFTEEQKSKLSQASKQKWSNPEYKEKLRQKQRDGWTEQRKEEQIKRLTGQKKPEHSAKMKGRSLDTNHPFFNKRKTEEHKENISKALKGKPKSKKHIENQKNALRNRSPERREEIKNKRRSNSNPKFEINGVSYKSLAHASEVLGLSPFKVKQLITRHF